VKKITQRQRDFVDAFLGPAKGNASKAAILVGYTKKSAGTIAWRLLKKVEVQAAINAKLAKREKLVDMSNAQIDALLIKMAQDDREQGPTRLGALRELDKVRGRHSMTHIFKGRLTLEQAIEAASKLDEK